MTSTRGSIAVVIATKNGSRYIGEALQSVFDQSRPPDDVVVVDDGSTDGTAEIVKLFHSARCLQVASAGANPARAVGIAATETEYVALLDHDDLWFPHHLETIAGLLDDAPVPAAFSRAKAFVGSIDPEPPRAGSAVPVDLWQEFPLNIVGGPTGVVMRRTALEQIGGWPTWSRTGTDAYMWFRIAELGPFLSWPTVTAGWRRHDGSQSSTLHRVDPVGYARGAVALLQDAFDVHMTLEPTDAQRAARRLADFSALVDVLSAMCLGDMPALGAELDDLGRRGAPSDDLVGGVGWMLFNAVTRESQSWRNIWRAYAHWPRRHRDLRRLIVDPFLANAVGNSMRSHPREPSQWRIPLAVPAALGPLVMTGTRAALRRFNRRYRYSTSTPGGTDRRVSST